MQLDAWLFGLMVVTLIVLLALLVRVMLLVRYVTRLQYRFGLTFGRSSLGSVGQRFNAGQFLLAYACALYFAAIVVLGAGVRLFVIGSNDAEHFAVALGWTGTLLALAVTLWVLSQTWIKQTRGFLNHPVSGRMRFVTSGAGPVLTDRR